LHEARGDLRVAEKSYRAALEILPTLSEACIALARVYRQSETPQLAINLLVGTLKTDPSDTEALVALGQALLADGRAAQAIEALQRVLTYDEGHVGALFYRGIAFAKLRRYTEALKDWELVVGLEPDGGFAREARKHARTALDLKHIFQDKVA
jgi:cytochrome c-type biogenesis protein CcmH/NrfG